MNYFISIIILLAIFKGLEVKLGQKNEYFSRNGATVFYNPELDQGMLCSCFIQLKKI